MTTRRAFMAAPLTLAAQSILEIPPAPAGSRIAYGPGEFQFGELRMPAGRGPHPVLIVIHGGYWRARYDLAHIGHFCEAFTKQGLAPWSLEYRRIGNPSGGFPGTFDDVCAGAAHLKQIAAARNLDLARVVAAGHSAGGHLALYLAGRKTIALRGVAALAPVADLRRAWELKLSNTVVAELLGGSPKEFPDRYRMTSPVEMVPLGVRERVLHGSNDDVVPMEISRRFAAAAKKAGDDCKLIEVAGAGHFELIDPRSDAWSTVRTVVLELVQ
jgi:acetyl esterase/lipase